MTTYKRFYHGIDPHGNKIYFNVIDIDISTGCYIGYMTQVDRYNNECLLGGYSLMNKPHLISVKPEDERQYKEC